MGLYVQKQQSGSVPGTYLATVPAP